MTDRRVPRYDKESDALEADAAWQCHPNTAVLREKMRSLTYWRDKAQEDLRTEKKRSQEMHRRAQAAEGERDKLRWRVWRAERALYLARKGRRDCPENPRSRADADRPKRSLLARLFRR